MDAESVAKNQTIFEHTEVLKEEQCAIESLPNGRGLAACIQECSQLVAMTIPNKKSSRMKERLLQLKPVTMLPRHYQKNEAGRTPLSPKSESA